MSTSTDAADASSPLDALLLGDFLRRELVAIPIEHWGYFFPCHVAVWRFIQAKRPGTLGDLNAGYDKEPYFQGRGAEWFCSILGNHNAYLDLLERIMYPLAAALPSSSRERGFLQEAEVPTIDSGAIEELASVVLSEAESAVELGLIR
jgi:hypothetical protein